jgi:hypothetical protein
MAGKMGMKTLTNELVSLGGIDAYVLLKTDSCHVKRPLSVGFTVLKSEAYEDAYACRSYK